MRPLKWELGKIASKVAGNQPPKQRQLPMEKMLNPRYDRHRQMLRARPIHHRVQRHSVIDLAVYNQGACM